MTPLLTTPRLRLRSPGIGDATKLAELLNNFAVSGNLARVPHPYTIDHADAWLGSWRAGAKPAETSFIIEHIGEGAVGVLGFDNKQGEAHIGYWLGEPHWGHGIMTEATTAAVTWYFDTTKDEYITSGVFHFNMASLAIQQKLGFVETGRSTVHCLARNEDVEHIDTELTRDAFEAYCKRPEPQRHIGA